MDCFSIAPNFKSSARYSFGRGRDVLKPTFIYAIDQQAEKKEATPSPTKYEASKSFGKEGIHFSMGSKLERIGVRSGDKSDLSNLKK